MRSSYKRIGDHIKLVDNRNYGHNVKTLLGLSITKKFIPSVANIVGTDMENYKIIRKNQFACSIMQVRRDKKMPVALLKEVEEAIISQAYPIFEIINPKELLPEYLMMWFSRQEFDREACFHAVGGVRGSLEWDDFCDMQLPIPHPDTQREVVKEYNTIVDRINLNNQMIQKLEEAAQAIYKQWFVDFEFPDGEGKPYKSNGGAMEWNEELEMEVPKGWEVKPFSKVVQIGGGGTPSTEIPEYWGKEVPFYTPGDLTGRYYSIKTVKAISELGLKRCSSKLYPVNTTFVTARGATVGGIAIAGIPMAMNQTCYALICNKSIGYFTHQLSFSTISRLKKEAIGATFEALVTKDFDGKIIVDPKYDIMLNYDKVAKPIYDLILEKEKTNMYLSDFKGLLLSKLATIA